MIIVLTLGRSGSSVLLQTLELLGVEVIGRKFDQYDDPVRAKLHHELNPGGYMEEPEIYHGGPSSDAFRRYLGDGSALRACKMDLRHLSDRSQARAWLSAIPSISTLLVSFRNPSEQAASEFTASGHNLSACDERTRFMFQTQFLEEYCANYRAVSQLEVGPFRALEDRTHFVDFAEISNRRPYVDRLAKVVSIEPNGKRFDEAVSNLSTSLMRIRADELDEKERRWAMELGAMEVFERMVTLSKSAKA